MHETSAGGLVIDGLDGPRDSQVAALIGRVDRRGRMLWSLPKGHIELGETAEQTAIREVAEETGIRGSVLAALGRIDYWFVTDGRRVHKTVHHYLMRFSGGELSDEDLEVAEVAWVPMHELPSRLAYADERRLAQVADELIDKLQSDGPASLPPLPPSSPRRRRPQTHSRTRACRQARHRPEERPRAGAVTAPRLGVGLLRLAAVIGIVAGFAVLTGAVLPRAAAGEPGATPFVRVRIDQVTPDVVTTTSEPVVTVSGMVTNIGDRPVRDVMVRLEHAAAVTASAGLRTTLDGDTDAVPAGRRLPHGRPRAATRARGRLHPVGAAALVDQAVAWASTSPGVYPVLVNVNGTPDYGAPARLDNARFLLPVVGVPARPARGDLGSAVAPDTSKPVWITMLWPLADRPRLAPGVPGGTIPVRLVDDELATSLASGGRLDILLSAAEVATSHDVDPDGARRPGAVPGRRPRPARHRQRDDRRLRGLRLARRSRPAARHPDPSGRRTGRGDRLAEPAARAGAPDLRGAAALRASRSGRPATRQRPGAERDRHHRRQQHRRPHPGRGLRPRRHACCRTAR